MSLNFLIATEQEDFQAALTFVDEYESSSSEYSEAPVVGSSARSARSARQQPRVAAEPELELLDELDIVEIERFVDRHHRSPGPEDERALAPQTPPRPTGAAARPPNELRFLRPVLSASRAAKKASPTSSSSDGSVGPKKPLSWDPNKARNERKAELMYLRKQVSDLQTQLSSIRTKKPRISSQIHPTPGGAGQQQHIVPAAKPSERNPAAVGEMLHKKATTKGIEKCVEAKRVTHVYAPTPDRSDSATFEELLAGVMEAHCQTDAVFEANGLAKSETRSDAKVRLNGSNGIYLEVFAGKILPFDVHSTSDAVWTHFANPNDTRPFRHYYNETSGETQIPTDTLMESFNMVLYAKSTSAIFKVKRILRRYDEGDRIVIVWWAFIDPIELSDEPLSGVRFLEKGYIVIKKPSS
ncbi:hypothetical protein PybrP1_010713, partial [[Pythium] brassicae (nom. inval.)]